MSFWGVPIVSICIKWKNVKDKPEKNILGKEYVSWEDALKTLNNISFEDIVFINKAKLMYKMAHNIGPTCLTELFEMKGGGVH